MPLFRLFLRASQALRSHARDVRDVARDTLKKISISLGPSYFPMILKEMRSVLQRGYQVHILGYTVHSLLEAGEELFVSGDMNKCIDVIMEVNTTWFKITIKITVMETRLNIVSSFKA